MFVVALWRFTAEKQMLANNKSSRMCCETNITSNLSTTTSQFSTLHVEWASFVSEEGLADLLERYVVQQIQFIYVIPAKPLILSAKPLVPTQKKQHVNGLSAFNSLFLFLRVAQRSHGVFSCAHVHGIPFGHPQQSSRAPQVP